jgi:hypothetical protein
MPMRSPDSFSIPKAAGFRFRRESQKRLFPQPSLTSIVINLTLRNDPAIEWTTASGDP